MKRHSVVEVIARGSQSGDTLASGAHDRFRLEQHARETIVARGNGRGGSDRGSIAPVPESSPTPYQPGDSRWWCAKRAAAYIGAGAKEIYKAVRAGKLKAVRLNERGDIRTTREWVDEWMEQKQLEQRVM